MIKRTLYFGNPAYLSLSQQQLMIKLADGKTTSAPFEDIGMIMLDHARITITQSVIWKCLEENVALITCDDTHHPTGLLLNLNGHTLQSQKFQAQLAVSLPRKKQLWQQTVMAKIQNQAALLEIYEPASYLRKLATKVKSGDSANMEAQAASYYWKHLFPGSISFTRTRFGPPPNNLLNYGYSILRALVARSLVGSGLLPTLGIHHRNQYNAYCLADDIMEPYRPYVDRVVLQMVRMNGNFLELGPTMKKTFLALPTLDVMIEGKKSPLMNAVQRSTASLAKCFEGSRKTILFPTLS